MTELAGVTVDVPAVRQHAASLREAAGTLANDLGAGTRSFASAGAWLAVGATAQACQALGGAWGKADVALAARLVDTADRVDDSMDAYEMTDQRYADALRAGAGEARS